MRKEILGAGIVGGIIGGVVVACKPKAMKLNFEEAPHKLLEKFEDDETIDPDEIEPEDLGGDDLD